MEVANVPAEVAEEETAAAVLAAKLSTLDLTKKLSVGNVMSVE